MGWQADRPLPKEETRAQRVSKNRVLCEYLPQDHAEEDRDNFEVALIMTHARTVRAVLPV